MRRLLIVPMVMLLVGCSQEDKETKSSQQNGITVQKVVAKVPHKKEALVCLEDAGKITCKLLTQRINKERDVTFDWISPQGKKDRHREMSLPANHASIYDARTIKGRAKGRWKVAVELDGEKISTTFKL